MLPVTVKVYEIEDEHILEAFFGDDAPLRPLLNFGADHGKVIFEGSMAFVPGDGDLFTTDGKEYSVLFRIFKDSGDVEVLVHLREFEDNEVS